MKWGYMLKVFWSDEEMNFCMINQWLISITVHVCKFNFLGIYYEVLGISNNHKSYIWTES